MITADPSAARRVLLTDSECGRAAALAAALRCGGYDVVVSRNADQLLERLQTERFVAIVDDWSRSGPELLAHARGNGHAGYNYVILTGDSPEELQRGMAAGADDFLVGPVDATVLLARLRVAEHIAEMQEAVQRQSDGLRETNRQLTAVNERMRRELDAAARVQQALLPSASFRAPGTAIGWKLRPCHELAGDILNCLRLDEHHLAFYVLDVSGHGVSSALLSVQVSRLMSPMMTESELLKQRLDRPPWYRVVEPAGVVARLNELFQSSAENTQYFTIVYGLLHVKSGHLRLAVGGHPGPVIVSVGGEATRIACRSRPVGLFPEADFEQHELTLGGGDRIWLYSDGATDAGDAEGRAFGIERLRHAIVERRDLPVQRAVESVLETVERWSDPAEPEDDCTLLAIERCTAGVTG